MSFPVVSTHEGRDKNSYKQSSTAIVKNNEGHAYIRTIKIVAYTGVSFDPLNLNCWLSVRGL